MPMQRKEAFFFLIKQNYLSLYIKSISTTNNNSNVTFSFCSSSCILTLTIFESANNSKAHLRQMSTTLLRRLRHLSVVLLLCEARRRRSFRVNKSYAYLKINTPFFRSASEPEGLYHGKPKYQVNLKCISVILTILFISSSPPPPLRLPSIF